MAPNAFAIVNADVVLPDRILPRGTVVVQDGAIAMVAPYPEAARSLADEVIDADGALLLPGLVDLHNDALELEINPRPRANLPLPFALATLERRLLSAGVTTEFHALAFMEMSGSGRTADSAARQAAYLAELNARGGFRIDHQVLHRIDVWSPQHLDMIFASTALFRTRYVSINDHTPGQGQYPDLDRHVQRMTEYAAMRGAPPPKATAVYERAATRAADTATVPAVYERIGLEARRQGLIISTHDDDSPAKVDAQHAIGATITEFPVSFEAAERARALGMTIVVGAPNVVRGGSQSGNLSAIDLFKRGLADVICADYHAPSVLMAAVRLAREGILDLPAAVRTISQRPAEALGLRDRGAIVPGLRADLAMVRLDRDDVPHVEAVFTRGRNVLRCERVC